MFWRRFSRVQLRGAGAALLVSLVGAGFSAQALGPQAAEPTAAAAARPLDDQFPGAAYYTAVDESELAAPAGATGTAPLPALPAGIDAAAAVDGTIQPARPFVLAGSPTDKARAQQCLTTAIYYEAANEPSDGQRAVAQVVLNRVRHPAFPGTVCGVVFQGSERRGCQFSFACDGAMARQPARAAWDRASRVAAAALAGDVFAPVGLATHYHTFAVAPGWNRNLVMTGVFGAHFFHRWQGWWGTAPAFRQTYAGHEPLPAPHAPAQATPTQAATAFAPAPVPASVPGAKPAPTPRAQIQPAYAESGAPQPGYAEPALPESQILDKWKDSGKPLR